MLSIRENKYLVIKKKDLDKYFLNLNLEGKNYVDVIDTISFNKVLNGIKEMRKKEGKNNNNYIICNQDEWYSKLIWKIILWGEEVKHRNIDIKQLSDREVKLLIDELDNIYFDFR